MKKTIIIILMFSSVINAWGWNDKITHRTISRYAADRFFDTNFLVENYTSANEVHTALEWILQGAELEDAGTKWQFINGTARSLNHFHVPTITNPTKNTLETAGLSDRASGMSAIRWAQTGLYQMELGWEDWSWSAVRKHQYNYLTSLNKPDEDANLARMLMGLGYQMHLAQDMGHPSHVRNNTHILDGAGWSGFETWAAKNDTQIIRNEILEKKDASRNYVFPVPTVTVDLTAKFDETHALAPVARLFDTRSYLGTNTPTTSLSQGLSEYTNGNFFSQDTVFAAERFGDDTSNKYYFPYPRKEGTDVQQLIENKKAPYISKLGEGESVVHFARAGVGTRFWRNTLGVGKRFYGSFKLDDTCYLDYAQKLIPRAVGYSTAMLDYFFRGEFTVTVPPDMPPTNKRIRLYLRNTTETGEGMTSGSIELMVIYRQYKKVGTASAGVLVPDGDFQFRKYPSMGYSGIVSTDDALYEFDLSNDPLPPLARDVSLIVVYRGKLGNEQDAVAYEQIYVDTISGEIELSLPPQGVYAKAEGDAITSTFNDFSIAGISTRNALYPGNAELLVVYKEAKSDPFLSQEVESSPEIKYASVTLPQVSFANYFPPGSENPGLSFSLAEAPVPVTATDVYVYVIHTDANGKIAFGFKDISEPTPVDIFSNTDKVCLWYQWYDANSPEALLAADPNWDHVLDYDPFSHSVYNIFAKYTHMSTTEEFIPVWPGDYTFASLPMLSGGTFRRLGYLLTDYRFRYRFTEEWWKDVAGDEWPIDNYDLPLFGTAVKNQTDFDGTNSTHTWPQMYSMRGHKMWWGAGLVYDNEGVPNDDSCDWSTLVN